VLAASVTLDTAPETYAWLSGANVRSVFIFVFVPALLPAAVAAAATTFMLTAQDVDSVLMTAPPGYSTLAHLQTGLVARKRLRATGSP